MTRTEIRDTFPFLIEYTPIMWFPMQHINCRCILYFEETDEPTPKPDTLTTNQLIDKVKTEIISKNQDVIDPNLSQDEQIEAIKQGIIARNQVTVNPELSQTEQLEDIKHQIQQGLSPEEIEDDEDLWDLIALGILGTLGRRKEKETK